MTSPLAKAYDCERKGCAARAEYIVYLKDYEEWKFFACSHDLQDMLKTLFLFARAFKTKLMYDKISEIRFEIPE